MTTMLSVLVVCYRVTGRLCTGLLGIFMNIALLSPPPVGLAEVTEVTEGFPLDLCVPSRVL